MKQIYLILLFVVASMGLTYGQYYYLPFVNAGQNPGGLNTDDENPSGVIAPLGWSEVIASGGTTWSAAQTIPFTFDFNGNSYTSYSVSPYGVVTFTSNPAVNPGNTPAALPDANIPDNSICAWGLDLSGGNDNVMSKTFGSAPNRQHWLLWVSASWPGLAGTGWAYWGIVMEESSNKVYVVDARNFDDANNVGPGLSIGLQYSSSSALMVNGSPNVTSQNLATGGNGSDASDNTYYMFAPGTQPANDIIVNGTTLPDFVETGNAVDITGGLTNLGASTLSSYTLNYSVNNGTPVSENKTASVNSLASTNFAHGTQWTPTASGTYTIKVWTSSPNGMMDGDPTNDTATTTIDVVDTIIQRMPLYEVFTSSTCGPCLAGNANYHGVVQNFPDEYVSIKYQVYWPSTGDPYCTEEVISRVGYYGINSVPRMEIDGGWDQNASSFTSGLHQQAYANPSFVALDVEYELDEETQTVEYNYTIESFVDLGNARLRVAVIEEETFDNVRINGETEFLEVMKKMLPDENGTFVQLDAGAVISDSGSYTFNGDYRLPPSARDIPGAGWNYIGVDHSIEHSIEEFDDLYVIAWLQNDANLEVHQAAVGTYRDTTSQGGGGTGFAELASVTSFNMFPNPSSAGTDITVSLELSQANNMAIEVFDVVGSRVLALPRVDYTAGSHQIYVNTSSLRAGTYFVSLVSDEGRSVRPLVIK